MSAFKAQRDLHGLPGDDDDDDEDGEEVSESGDEDDQDEEHSEEETTELASGAPVSDHKAKKREREWLAANFIQATQTDTGAVVYKSELLPDKAFFSKDKLQEFLKGKRYKRLLHEMKKGMRSHADTERLQAKASARRERLQTQKQERLKEKRKRKTEDADAEEIERRKASFAAKKARRLERKTATAAKH